MSRSARNRQNRRATAAPCGEVSQRNLIRSESLRQDDSTPILLRPSDVTLPRKNRRPGRDKGQAEWRTVSPYYFTAATIDSRWSA